MLTKNEQIIVRAALRSTKVEIRFADGISHHELEFEKDGEFCRDLADAIYGYLIRRHEKKN